MIIIDSTLNNVCILPTGLLLLSHWCQTRNASLHCSPDLTNPAKSRAPTIIVTTRLPIAPRETSLITSLFHNHGFHYHGRFLLVRLWRNRNRHPGSLRLDVSVSAISRWRHCMRRRCVTIPEMVIVAAVMYAVSS